MTTYHSKTNWGTNLAKDPKISVIMSAYNSDRYIEESILSILNQTFRDFELIIIDDCSTDSVPEVIKKYQELDPRILAIRNETNSGVAVSRNKGIKLAKADYIAIMDSDDIAYPKRLEIQYNFIENNPDVALIGCGTEIIDENGHFMKKRIGLIDPDEIKFRMLLRNPFIHSSVFYRKKIFEESDGYNKEYEYSEDYAFFSFLAGKYQLASIPEVLIKYRENPQSVTSESETRKIQLENSYKISHTNIGRYLNLALIRTRALLNAVNRRGINFKELVQSMNNYRKLVGAYIYKENLTPVRSAKVFKIYKTDKEMAIGGYLKAKLPFIYSLVKIFKR